MNELKKNLTMLESWVLPCFLNIYIFFFLRYERHKHRGVQLMWATLISIWWKSRKLSRFSSLSKNFSSNYPGRCDACKNVWALQNTFALVIPSATHDPVSCVCSPIHSVCWVSRLIMAYFYHAQLAGAPCHLWHMHTNSCIMHKCCKKQPSLILALICYVNKLGTNFPRKWCFLG